MNCQEMAEFLAQYLEGELPAEQAEVFKGHLDKCGHCVDYVENYKAVIKLGKECVCHEGDMMPKEVPPELIRAILDARKQGS